MRAYKCPYCEYRAGKDDLIDHIDDKHDDMIPEGFTPTRVVFNLINNKTNGVCVVCGKPTDWNEKAGKYSRLCNDPKCKEELRKQYEKNMLKVYNKTTLLDDADHQQKMLANRSISGKYTFKDGGKITFTGSYEKKALEFFDKVLNVSSKDIMAPGPVFEYKFEGKKLKWITDIIYIPYNLVIEVKDGGDNPNTRQMETYRDKQVAKEKMITNLGTYNYLRLTNNSFDQLLEVLAELKSKVLDNDDTEKVIRINEEIEMLLNMYMQPKNEFLDLLNEEVKLGKVSKQDFEDIKTIYATLTNEEKKYIGGVTNSPKVAFSKIYREGPKPVAFVRGFDFNRGEIIIEVCVASYARGKGYGIRGVKDCVAFTKKEKYERAVYLVNKKNTASIDLAKKCGFKLEAEKKEYFIYTIELNKSSSVTEYTNITRLQSFYNEVGCPGCVVGMNPGAYVVSYGYKNTFTDDVEGFALSNDIISDNILTVDEHGKIKKESYSFLEGRKVTFYKFKGDISRYKNILENVNTLEDLSKAFFYEELSGNDMLSSDQICFDDNFSEFNMENTIARTTTLATTIIEGYRELTDGLLYLPVMNQKDILLKEDKLRGHEHLDILEDSNGYFVKNNVTGFRSVSYSDIREINIEGVLVNGLREG